MDLSILIATRNTSALTRAAIRSVYASEDKLAKEVILADNGSSDDSPSTIPREFPRVRYLRHEANLGFARAMNSAARAAQGEFLLLLNSDACLGPGALGAAVSWMRTQPDCAVAGAQLLNADGSRQNSIAPFPSLATELLNKSLLRRCFPGRFPGKETNLTAPLPVDSVVGAFFLTRRDIWENLGGMDERFFFFFEETDYCLRARSRGCSVYHLPQVQVWHGQGKSAGQYAAAARIEYWRSRYLYFRKHHSSVALWLLRAGLLLRLGADTTASSLMYLACLGRSQRWRQKNTVCWALLRWHGRLCSAGAGLPR